MPQFKWTNEEGEEDDQARLWESKLGVKQRWGILCKCVMVASNNGIFL